MLKRFVFPSILMLLGFWGLAAFALMNSGDSDPRLYYITAGKCLGRTSKYFCKDHDISDPLYSQALMSGGTLMLPFNRMVPYRDFQCEYPPAALITFIVPRFFTDDVDTYYDLFMVEMAIVAIGLWWIAIKILQILQPDRNAVAVASTLWMFWIWASGRVLLHRFDMVAIFFVAFSIFAILRRQWNWAGFWLGIGIAVKVYPIFLLVPTLIFAFGDRRWNSALRFLAVASIAPILSHLALFPWAGTQVFSYLTYHSDRGFEVESIWTQLILFFNAGGHGIHSQMLYGADQLVSINDLHPWIIASYTAMAISNLTIAVIAFWFVRTIEPGSARWRGRVVMLLLSSLAFTIVTAKVLSIQYVFWLFPMAMLLPGRAGQPIAFAYIVALLLGHFWFPNYWAPVSELTTAAMILVFSRNALILLIALLGALAAATFGGLRLTAMPAAQPIEPAGA